MGNWRRFIFCSDIHGSEQDKRSNDVMFKFLDEWKPHIRIAGGDIWDFSPLRRKADDFEKRQSMADDFVAGKRWLEKFKPHYFIRGNHDERLWQLLERGDGVLSDYANAAIGEIMKLMKSLNCEMLPYDKRAGVLTIGDLSFIHGYSRGVYAARNSALVYGNVIQGDLHTIAHQTIPGLEDRAGWIAGCMCKLDWEYNRTHIQALAHRHGFVYGIINTKTGRFKVLQAEEIGEHWIIPSDVRIF